MSRINPPQITSIAKYTSRSPVIRTYSADLASNRSVGSSHASSASAHSTVDLAEKNRMKNEVCFITNDPSDLKDCAHLINAVRVKGDPERAKIKKQVEDYLRLLGVVGKTFHLNHPSNKIYLTPSLHRALDSCGYIALTCDKKTLTAFEAFFKEENNIWEYHCNPSRASPYDRSSSGYRYLRDVNPQFQLLPLYPANWLKEGTKLLVYGDVSLATGRRESVTYSCSADNGIREHQAESTLPPDSSQPAFGPFERRHKRSKAMRDTQRPKLSPDDEELLRLTISVGNLIYTIPPHITIVATDTSTHEDRPARDEDDSDGDVSMSSAQDTPDVDEMGRHTSLGGNGDAEDRTLTQGRLKRPRARVDIPPFIEECFDDHTGVSVIHRGHLAKAVADDDNKYEDHGSRAGVDSAVPSEDGNGDGYETPESARASDAVGFGLKKASLQELESAERDTFERVIQWRQDLADEGFSAEIKV